MQENINIAWLLNLCYIFLISICAWIFFHYVAISFFQKFLPFLVPIPCTIWVSSFLLVQLVSQGSVIGPLCDDLLFFFSQCNTSATVPQHLHQRNQMTLAPEEALFSVFGSFLMDSHQLEEFSDTVFFSASVEYQTHQEKNHTITYFISNSGDPVDSDSQPRLKNHKTYQIFPHLFKSCLLTLSAICVSFIF